MPVDRFRLADWLGIPFLPHGRSMAGADCYGLVYLVYGRIFGIDLPPLVRLSPNVSSPRLTGPVMTREARGPLWRRIATPDFGDVILFGTPMLFYHVGLYLAPGRMLHTRLGTDSTPESFTSPIWQPRLQGFLRHKDITDG